MLWPFSHHVGSIRNRAKKRGLICQITVDELKQIWTAQGGLCFWTGKAMDFQVGAARHPYRPSIDKIDPAKGYVADNIVWASNFANRARGELSAQDFAQIMRDFGFTGAFEEKWP